MRGDQTVAWQGLTALAKAFSGFDLRDAFASDSKRAAHFSQEAPGVFADLSKNHWDARIEAQLLALAEQAGVLTHRNRMFQGEAINATENRAVMHWLLRHPAEGAAADALPASVKASLKEVHETLNAMLSFAEKIRSDDTTPVTTGNCEYRIVKGGSYSDRAHNTRLSARDALSIDAKYPSVGFRLVREIH